MTGAAEGFRHGAFRSETHIRACAHVAGNQHRLTDLPEIIDVLALTRAMVHPCDRLAWLALLRAPWIGWDWTDLHTLVVDDTRSTVWELLQDEARLAAISDDARAALGQALPVLRSLRSVSRSACEWPLALARARRPPDAVRGSAC